MTKAIVVILTYNLEKYISAALDSVLCQKTNFDYKVVVADDCSHDNTISILKKYKKEYGNKIELIFSERNLGSLQNSNRVLDALECEYFSLLDGDDYWIGEDRLQKQVEFMDAHPDYMICGGNTQYLRNGKLCDLVIVTPPHKNNNTYSFSDMLNDKMPFVHTSSILLRNSIFINGLPACFKEVEDTFENCALRGEDFRRILHLEKGPMFLMNDVLSVYRIHEKGLWQSSSELKRLIEGAISWNFFKKYFKNKYGDFFGKKAQIAYRNLMTTLAIDYNFFGQFKLNSENTELLTSLMRDLQSDNEEKRSMNLLLRKTLSYIYKILTLV